MHFGLILPIVVMQTTITFLGLYKSEFIRLTELIPQSSIEQCNLMYITSEQRKNIEKMKTSLSIFDFFKEKRRYIDFLNQFAHFGVFDVQFSQNWENWLTSKLYGAVRQS